MPKLVSEIASGAQFQRSSENGRSLTDAQTRVFRILLNQPGEVVNPQVECGITVGQRHPVNTNIYCVSWDVKFDGDSRTVLIATFNYQSTPAVEGDKNEQPPDVRPANWSTSTNLIESPVSSWEEIGPDNNAIAPLPTPAINPAGDMYDGVSRYEPIITITVEQFEFTNPMRHCLWAGRVNADTVMFGTLSCQPGSLMFRGVQHRPTVESWGDAIYRGWMATYEFAYRRNYVRGLWDSEESNLYNADIGWDIAVPQTGFNVKCDLNANDVDKAGMPLMHEAGKIKDWPNNVSLPDNVAVGQKARGMVLVYEYENGGASQLPCAQPIPLNDDGTPRIDTATPKIILRRYRPNDSVSFRALFDLRLG